MLRFMMEHERYLTPEELSLLLAEVDSQYLQ